jgi:arabinose-5-phosphate isomerase
VTFDTVTPLRAFLLPHQQGPGDSTILRRMPDDRTGATCPIVVCLLVEYPIVGIVYCEAEFLAKSQGGIGHAIRQRQLSLYLSHLHVTLMTDHSIPHVSKFIKILRVEEEAIRRIADHVQPEQVERAIQLIANCAGKVVMVGVGKSGFIARKIAATLTSTGTRAIYLHPSDALHGDIGIIEASDVVVLLSNSGETGEILAMLPFIRSRKTPLIAILGNLRSTLGRSADAVLDASVEMEACPFNLAPTASTTVALALGDALALTLMEIKGLTPDDFAFNHPAGQLGKRLTLKVADLMHSGADNPTVLPTASWLEVISAISRGGLGGVNVIDREGMLAGIITDGDLRRAIQKSKPADLENLTAEMFMTSQPTTIRPEELAYTALRIMEDRPTQISVLPVVEGTRRSVGLLRLHDVVRSGL